uniref:Protein phosphatase 2c n=1 Tax=Rhizophora mucronata TaxID=61149 RepID=A0A2P2MHE2_RHIMU
MLTGNELPTTNPSLELIKEGSLSKFSIWVCKISQCNGQFCFLLLLPSRLSISWLPCSASWTHIVIPFGAICCCLWVSKAKTAQNRG